jgi:pimeloyl-ACP methyl ester carboxylesterase
MGRIVLVHGAWHGGWCWEEVVPHLEDAGHQVITSELHRGSLAGDIAAVQADVDGLGDDVVVCGHSYGGMVITGLRPDHIKHAVYLAALLPDADQGAVAIAGSAPDTDLSGALLVTEDGMCTVAADRLVDIFYADCSPAQQKAAVDRLRPQVMATLAEAPGRALWQEVESTYVVCGQDRAIHPDLQAELAKKASRRVDWDTSHSPFYSAPDRLAELLSSLAS